MSAVRKLFLALVAALLVYVGARWIRHALASPETKIRWRLEEMVEGFDAMRAGPVLAGFDPAFVDHVSGATREDVRSLLAWMFFEELDDKGKFLWDAELDPDALSIQVADDAHSATAACRVQFFRRHGDSRRLDWDARIAGTLTSNEQGWQWTAVTSANHSDRQER